MTEETSKIVEEYTPQEGTASDFKVANYYCNDMVVPRDRRIVIWGTAPDSEEGKIVAAEFKGLKGSGVIKDGAFSFALNGTLPASKEKGHSIYVRGAAGVEKEFTDVLVGDIWVVSGQSNADLTFGGTVAQTTKDIQNLYSEYMKNATKDDDIRVVRQINWDLLNTAGKKRMATPQTDFAKGTKWQIAERKRVFNGGNSFSMLGYFFAKELYTLNPDVPIGMIMAACGGCSLVLLASPDAAEKFPDSLKNRSLTINGVNIPPSGIYNAFMAPFINVGITGMIFYQGESDTDVCSDYIDALKIMIEDLREKFGSNFLFLNVQLTSYGYESGGVSLAGIWDTVPDMRFAEAEIKTDRSISGYEVIPSIDVGWRDGDGDGAHPYYKYELGQRGAQMAASIIYGIGDMEDKGYPVPDKIYYDKNEVIIKYMYAGGGMKTVDGAPMAGLEVKVNGSWQAVSPDSITVANDLLTISVANAEGVRYAPELRYNGTENANICSGTGNLAVAFCAEFK